MPLRSCAGIRGTCSPDGRPRCPLSESGHLDPVSPTQTGRRTERPSLGSAILLSTKPRGLGTMCVLRGPRHQQGEGHLCQPEGPRLPGDGTLGRCPGVELSTRWFTPLPHQPHLPAALRGRPCPPHGGTRAPQASLLTGHREVPSCRGALPQPRLVRAETRKFCSLT